MSSNIHAVDNLKRLQFNLNDGKVLEAAENIVGEGENADDRHFLLFQSCCQQLSPKMVVKISIIFLMARQNKRNCGCITNPTQKRGITVSKLL